MIRTDWRGVLVLLGMLFAVIIGLLARHEDSPKSVNAPCLCEKEKRAAKSCEVERLETIHELQYCQERLVNDALKIRR